MSLRRFTEHIRTQKWGAVIVDLAIVVVGIFLAVQIDRLYEDRRNQAEERDHLLGLAEDFAASRAALESAISRQNRAIAAALELLKADSGDASKMTHDRFYELLKDIGTVRTFEPVHSTWDVLTASGDLKLIGDEALKLDIAQFFTLIERSDLWEQLLVDYQFNQFDSFVVTHLDHIAQMKRGHPGPDIESVPLIHPRQQFEDVLNREDFRSLISAKWHLVRDVVAMYQERLELVDQIEKRIADRLER